MIERRKFIKKATIGTVSLTSLGGLANIEQAFSNEVPENDDGRIGKEGGKASQHGSWEIDFNPESTRLTLRNQYTVISGKLSFTSDGTEWSVGSARDGAVNRNTLIDPYGNVQGYWTLNQSEPGSNCCFTTGQPKGLKDDSLSRVLSRFTRTLSLVVPIRWPEKTYFN